MSLATKSFVVADDPAWSGNSSRIVMAWPSSLKARSGAAASSRTEASRAEPLRIVTNGLLGNGMGNTRDSYPPASGAVAGSEWAQCARGSVLPQTHSRRAILFGSVLLWGQQRAGGPNKRLSAAARMGFGKKKRRQAASAQQRTPPPATGARTTPDVSGLEFFEVGQQLLLIGPANGKRNHPRPAWPASRRPTGDQQAADDGAA